MRPDGPLKSAACAAPVHGILGLALRPELLCDWSAASLKFRAATMLLALYSWWSQAQAWAKLTGDAPLVMSFGR